MGYAIILLLTSVLTGRLFSESLSLLPRFMDLLDLIFLPVFAIVIIPAAFLKQSAYRGVNEKTNSTIAKLSILFIIQCLVSTLANANRIFVPPALLYVFGMLEGPILLASLNLLVGDQDRFLRQLKKFAVALFFFEAFIVLFINLPAFFVTGGNPDAISGTFGYNGYQFSGILIMFGGYLLGKQTVAKWSVIYNMMIQTCVIFIFILMQYRTATPAFFLAYIIVLGLLYGRQLSRLLFAGVVIGLIGYASFTLLGKSGLNFRFEDLITLAEDVSVMGDRGKFLAYVVTIQMYYDMPHTLVVGCGPGTYISKAAVTFMSDPRYAPQAGSSEKGKGVGVVIQLLFGDIHYDTDVFQKYIFPLQKLDALFGSAQFNNTASSLLAPLAEVGIPGFIIIFLLYGVVVRDAVRFLRYANRTRDPEMLPWATALLIGVIYLCLLTPLDNYLETSRLTLPVWVLFWMVGKMFEKRWKEHMIQRVITLRQQEQAALPVTGSSPTA